MKSVFSMAHGFRLIACLVSAFFVLNLTVLSAAAAVSGFETDLNGWYRHVSTPTIGAVEYEVEETERDAAGRISKRVVAGRVYRYQYDALGRLRFYFDEENPRNNAEYEYDFLGRRILVKVGNEVDGFVTTRFVYDGMDVVAEYVDEDGNGTVDRKRVYWNLPELDQRVGFVDFLPGGTTKVYFFLTDQVGSVLQVVDESGQVVNQYDYDAFGNPIPENTFEGVENRYRFQGREFDEHRGDYYFRMRTYVPEWGMFTGPDRAIQLEANGSFNYLFTENNPLEFIDPEGMGVLSWLMGAGYSGDAAETFEKSLGLGLFQIGSGVKQTVTHPGEAVGRGIDNAATVMARGMTPEGGAVSNIKALAVGTSYLVSSAVGARDVLEASYGVDLLEERYLTGVEKASKTLIGAGSIALTATGLSAAYNPGATFKGSVEAAKQTMRNAGEGIRTGLVNEAVVEGTGNAPAVWRELKESALASKGASAPAPGTSGAAAAPVASGAPASMALVAPGGTTLPKPTVSDPKLQNIVNDLYKGTTNPSRVGTGTTADAVRNEIATGRPTGGKFHKLKAQQYFNALRGVLKQNLSEHDRLVAQSLLNHLQNALRGNP